MSQGGEVGTLLIRVAIIGNEVAENRNGFLSSGRVRDSQCHWKQWSSTSHIRILLLTFLWKFARDLILKGYVYCAMPPLYKITRGKDNTYLLDDNALAKYKAKHPGAALTISRFKGLGEMDTDQLEETTMSKDNRLLKQIDVQDVALCEKIVQNLMGEQVTPRKEFIAANAHKANIDM